jgi:hypothetical protein
MEHGDLGEISLKSIRVRKVEAVLHGGAVHLGDEPAGVGERRSVKSHPFPD